MKVWRILTLFGACSALGLIEGLPLHHQETPESQGALTGKCLTPKVTLGILPGRGWDSLQNKEMSQVIRLTYTDCKASKVGGELIPDHISLISVKETDMQLTSELFSHYINYTSVTLRGFKTGTAFPFLRGAAEVSGAFSPDSVNVKNLQISGKAATTRVHIRSTVYSTVVEPSAELEPAFRARIFKAAENLETGVMNEDVRYEMEMLVRDYGTHYQTEVDAGAMLVKEDFVKAAFVKEKWLQQNQIKAAASAKFVEGFGFGFSYEQKVDNKITEGYNTNLISSTLRAIGGPVAQQHMTINDWVSRVPENLAIIDRRGDPLYFLLKEKHFPNISRYTLQDLRGQMEDAVAAYYMYNTRKGCVDTDSPNFDRNANVDDRSCQTPLRNHTFGGLYTNCKSLTKEGSNICAQLEQINPLTGNFSCPSGFQAIPLNSHKRSFSKEDVFSTEDCTGWWIFSKCHKETTTFGVEMNVKYRSFWCAPTTSASNNIENGLLFGGVYSLSAPNPVTKSATCPSFFQPLSVGPDLKVCTSKDFNAGVGASVPFGGFFTCKFGNPFSQVIINRRVKSEQVNPPYTNNVYQYPQNCPPGYTQFTATIDNGCDVKYCTFFGDLALADDAFPLVRPPFRNNFDDFLAFRTLNTEISSYWAPALVGGGAGGIVGFCLLFIARSLCKCRKKAMKTAETNEENPPNS